MDQCQTLPFTCDRFTLISTIICVCNTNFTIIYTLIWYINIFVLIIFTEIYTRNIIIKVTWNIQTFSLTWVIIKTSLLIRTENTSKSYCSLIIINRLNIFILFISYWIINRYFFILIINIFINTIIIFINRFT